MQKNWIGKSFGCEIEFELVNCHEFKKIKIFTTRPDTLFGCSFLALSIDHPMSKLFEKDQKFQDLASERDKKIVEIIKIQRK